MITLIAKNKGYTSQKNTTVNQVFGESQERDLFFSGAFVTAEYVICENFLNVGPASAYFYHDF